MALWGVVPGGARPLAVPAGAQDPTDVFAGLPLGVYSGLRTYEHDRFLRLEDHVDRTDRSAELLGLDARLDRPALRATLREACAAWPHDEARVRFDLLAGPATARGFDGRVLVLLFPFVPLPEAARRDGVRVALTRELGREEPEIKRADFTVQRKPLQAGPSGGAYEHVLVDARDRLLEGSSSNLFVVRDGILSTPEDGVLAGITRRIVIELASATQLPFRATSTTVAELPALHEAFLTSSSRHLVPVVEIDGVRIGSGRVGPVTRRLMSAYDLYARREARRA